MGRCRKTAAFFHVLAPRAVRVTCLHRCQSVTIAVTRLNWRREIMNIVQTLLGLLTGPQLLGQLSKMLGMPESLMQKGLAAAVPSILGGLIAKGSTESGAGALIGMMKDHKIDAGMLDRLGGLFGGSAGDVTNMGGSILKNVLGGNLDSVSRLVGSVSGMPGDSASKLMALTAPAVLGGVAQAAPSGGFSPAGLAGLLDSQTEHFEKFAPPGLGAVLGIGGLGAAGSAAHANNAWPLGPWLAGAVVLGAALFSGLRTCSPRTEAPVAEATSPAVSEPAPAAAEPAPVAAEPAPAPEPVPGEIKLPSGATLNVPPGSVGENLFRFLSGPETGSKTFVFDGLTFDTGSASLDAKSQEMISAVASVLKEYPAVTVSVDGYTDNLGSQGSNLQLSERRAKAAMDALVAAGVETIRMKWAGHGDANAIAGNGTPEGRAQNRRTELTATKN
jgi:outer membrane protein OmpA-like peptidoglycan-associated protein